MTHILAVSRLNKQFDTHPVICDLSFSLKPAERLALLAPSGAGKSSLINLLSKVDSAYTGSFAVNAHNPVTIFQEPRLFPYMTVEENIFLPFRLQGKPMMAHHQQHYRQWLAVCGLASCTRHYPHQLSGGMKQKVALIRGFLTGPDLALMDEPFKSIDVQSKEAIMAHLLRCYPDTAMLLVTHNPEEIPLLAHRALVFSGQRLGAYTRLEAGDIPSRITQPISI
jgi:ABC-type nitrate/sulfonate/bicarbonate transport system ATPase subunit